MQAETITNKILPALINGETGRSIAKETNVHPSTISRYKAKLSNQIEFYQLQLINQSGQATVDNITTTIGRANSVLHDPTIPHKDIANYKDLLQLSHKKEVLIGQAMGILPSHSQASTVVNILNIDNRSVLSPGMQGLFDHQASDQEAEEAEFEVID